LWPADVRENAPQVVVKTNVNVDEGIAVLVAALSRFPFVKTTSSCQGHVDGSAHVCFVCDDWQSMSALLWGAFVPRFNDDGESDMRVQVSWDSLNGPFVPTVWLSVRKDRIALWAELITDIWENGNWRTARSHAGLRLGDLSLSGKIEGEE
jgi:hypothetical protein